MIRDVRIIKKDQQITTTWAGGTTTQLAIFPEGTVYADRDFTWRLSTAVVELEQSTFTKLPGFDRHLMVLEGKLELVHENQHTAALNQYEQDSFKGEWNTSSYGKARDFNLIVKEEVQGKLEQYRLLEEQCIALRQEVLIQREGFVACYCYKGAVNIQTEDETIVLQERELLVIQYTETAILNVSNFEQQESIVIIASIKK